MEYPRPAFTVDAVVLAGSGTKMSLLVIERAKPPFVGDWALPGGFVDKEESPFLACLRELEEETGLTLPPAAALPLNLRARSGRDPRGWTISQPFLFHLPETLPVQAADDAAAAIWMPLAGLERLAFDHGAILCEALGRFWQRMPTAAPALAGCSAYGCPQQMPQRLTFFGGSFNPVHPGHEACANNFPRPAELVIVPDNNPFKPGPGSRCYWALYRSLVSRFPQVLGVFPGFCGMEIPNPTFTWLPLVQVPEVGLLLGEDSLVALPGWNRADVLVAALAHLYVAPRRSVEADVDAALAWVKARNGNCRLERLPDHPWRDESSTKLRTS